MKGITVSLWERVQSGVDAFNHPVYEEKKVEVENVLVAPESSSEVLSILNLDGKKEVYTLGIPKGDEHIWTDSRIEFFGKSWKAVREPIQGIESLIPTKWHKKVTVERYE